MNTYFFVFTLSAILSFLLTPLIIRSAHRWQVLDYPSHIKVHQAPIPRLGGTAVFISFWITTLAVLFFPNVFGEYLRESQRALLTLFGGSFIIFALGVYDDIKGSGAILKLIVQIAVAFFVYTMGFHIEKITNPFGPPIMLGWFVLPGTILWIVGIINAVNLIDGLDGLASGVALIACLSLMSINFILRDNFLVLIMLIMSGALLGFLRYNFNPAKIFLGDSGSLFLGFILAVTSLMHDKKTPTLVTILIPVLILGFPIMDTFHAIFRRLKKRVSPFKGDKAHTHHLLLEVGLSHRFSVLLLYFVCLALGVLAFVISFQQNATVALVLFILGAVSILFLRQLIEAALHRKIGFIELLGKRRRAYQRLRRFRKKYSKSRKTL
jgi:UDP-GlcNAc:undecaprenyl-phosphate GlcNAc-1-phosphate transferase